MLVVAGDFNVKIGPDDARCTFHETKNISWDLHWRRTLSFQTHTSRKEKESCGHFLAQEEPNANWITFFLGINGRTTY